MENTVIIFDQLSEHLVEKLMAQSYFRIEWNVVSPPEVMKLLVN